MNYLIQAQAIQKLERAKKKAGCGLQACLYILMILYAAGQSLPIA